MANRLYPNGINAFLEGSIDWLTDNIKVAFVTSGYAPNFTTDQFISDVPGGDVVGTTGNLAGASATLGVADGSNLTLGSLTGAAVAALVMYKDTGTPSTSPLIAFIDTATGLPFTPTGGAVTIDWDTGANKIFAL